MKTVKFAAGMICSSLLLAACQGWGVIDTNSELYSHQDENVSFRATLATFAEQHPTEMLGRPASSTRYETYVNLGPDESQVVLVSEKPVTCEHDVQVQGVVRLINLYGDSGTKKEYSRIWVEVNKFECLPGSR